MISAGVRRVLGARSAAGTSAGFARANAETAELVEEYRYRRELSRNPWTASVGEPTGHIRVVIPYDGGEHFTRDAIADIEANGAAAADGKALIGHLVLSGYANTDLGVGAGLDHTAGAIPLSVELGEAVTTEDLSSDLQSYVISHDYRPDSGHLPGVPISVYAELLDPDGLDLTRYGTTAGNIKQLIDTLPAVDEVSAEGRRQFEQMAGETIIGDGRMTLRDLISDLATQIQQQASFRSSLQLRLWVVLHLPADVGPGVRPVLERVAVEWPTITSLRAVHLDIPALRTARPRIIYNPNTRCIEWFEVPTRPFEEEPHGGIRGYVSPPMVLTIEQPGELYEESKLRSTVTARIDDALLSGTDARLFDATGRLSAATEVTLRSVIEVETDLILGDAFTNRTRTPFQHLHFDQVIPDPARIADVVTALESRGFDVWKLSLAGDAARGEGAALKHFLLANRAEGPDVMELWIYIEGRHYATERQSQRAGGTKYTTKLASGELKIYVRGSLPGDSRELVVEMNALQKVLREQFARIQQIA